ncbi:MAG: hypothetical protein ACI8R4_003703 [Paracoccaceae bacterium]|jgi:hypothetical protein
MSRPLPETASIAHNGEDAKLVAPSAARNVGPICDLLERIAPATGTALELASGTGQHVIAYAAHFPGLQWQPTEIDSDRRASIDSYVAAAGLGNIAAALNLNAATPGWGARHGGQALILLSNLLHLISGREAQVLIAEAAIALAPGGTFVIYGPFMRGGELTSDGDARFHASLIIHDPEIGYKDDFDTMDLLQGGGLDMVDVIEMPANNLALIAQKPAF